MTIPHRGKAGLCSKFLAAALLLSSLSCAAQEYPSRTIRMIVPQAPGGGTDILGRFLAQKLSDLLRQPAVVENRTGAGSIVGTEFVARSPADGYTLMVGGIFNIVMNKALVKNLSHDPQRDFVPLGFTSAYPFLLLTRPDLPVSNLAELAKYAAERPGKLTYGSAGIGTLQHVWGAILFKSMGLDLLHVPFKGAAPAHQEMMAGRLDVLFDNLSASKQYVQGGRLKGLAVSSASRSSHLPNVPTVNEPGAVRFEGESWFGLFAPTGTPAAVVEVLRNAHARIVREPEFVARVESDGGRVMVVPPQEQQQFMQREIERWSAAVNRYAVTID